MTNEVDQKIIIALKTVFDPEIPVDIYELGLIYKCEITSTGRLITFYMMRHIETLSN